jgi:hypothetical protein
MGHNVYTPTGLEPRSSIPSKKKKKKKEEEGEERKKITIKSNTVRHWWLMPTYNPT